MIDMDCQTGNQVFDSLHIMDAPPPGLPWQNRG
jgi:hypothetical protein